MSAAQYIIYTTSTLNFSVEETEEGYHYYVELDGLVLTI